MSIKCQTDEGMNEWVVLFYLGFMWRRGRGAAMEAEEGNGMFSRIAEDILINIFSKLEDDPRYLACLACVCTRFGEIIRSICWKNRCMRVFPTVVADLMQTTRRADRLAEPPGGWSVLQKLAVCCPGLWHAGVLLECWDFGLERELGPSDQYAVPSARSEANGVPNGDGSAGGTSGDHSSCYWTHFDDLPFEKACRVLEGSALGEPRDQSNLPGEEGLEAAGNRSVEHQRNPAALGFVERLENPSEEVMSIENREVHKRKDSPSHDCSHARAVVPHCADVEGAEVDSKKRKKKSHVEPHLATGVWNLTREQGNKLLASRFRSDSLYICDWPGCIHSEEKRKYRLFRGMFKNFKSSHVWRNIKDMKAKKTVVNCAFCTSEGTWDMLTAFCLRRSFEYHDDGQPAVRAYVCENGHVAGAWTDRPMYN